MNCRGWNPNIALYVEGDLDRDVARELEIHLSSCVECRDFADTLRLTQSELRQLRSETIETSSLNRVRAGVLDQVRAMEMRRTWMDRTAIWLWGGYRWRYAVLGSVAVFAAALWIWQASSPHVPAPETVKAVSPHVGRPETGQVAVAGGGPGAPVKRHIKATGRMKPAEPAADEKNPDTVVQILTDDPNVVIYWLIDQTGGF